MLTVKTPEEALLTLEAAFPPRPSPEEVPLGQARGRILFAPVVASEYVPGFDRSTVDGYTIRSADTFGCSDAIPAILKLRGEILMGTGAEEALESGCCVAVPTGGAMPPGCDAVVMVEDVIRQKDGTVRLYASAAPWQHIRQIGEDVCAGEMILGSRAVISPAAIGAMLAAGVLEAEVLRRPVVGIIPTGDEIVPPPRTRSPGTLWSSTPPSSPPCSPSGGRSPGPTPLCRTGGRPFWRRCGPPWTSATLCCSTPGPPPAGRTTPPPSSGRWGRCCTTALP